MLGPGGVLCQYFLVVTFSSHLDAGRAALDAATGRPRAAAFDARCRPRRRPEALEGLGLAAWWLDLADVVFDVARARVSRLPRARRSASARRAWPSGSPGTPPRSAAKQAIANGWLQRAHRLLEGQPDSRRTRVARAAQRRLRAARRRRSRKRRRRWRPRRADRHGARRRRLRDGRPRAARLRARDRRPRGGRPAASSTRSTPRCSPARCSDRVLIGLACCYLIAACERIRDYERAVQWCDRLKAFCAKWGLPAAVRRLPHAVRLGLHVARRVGGSRARADVGLRRARGLPSRR